MPESLEELSVGDVVELLEWCDMKEFLDFVTENKLDGRRLLETSDGTLRLWRPNANTEKFVTFTKEMQQNPKKYLNYLKTNDMIMIKETNLCSSSQYQTVSVKKISQQDNITNCNRVEEILKKVTAPKSFLYRHNPKRDQRQERSVTAYVPMNANTEKKTKKFFRLSSYDYPIFNRISRLSKTDSNTDRGYYPVSNTFKDFDARPEPADLTCLDSAEENIEKNSEDHFYEDLSYNDIKETNKEILKPVQPTQVKPCITKLQELFLSFKLPFFKRPDDTVRQRQDQEINDTVKENDGNEYENNSFDMYDSIHVVTDQDCDNMEKEHTALTVEDYLEPVQVSKDYCDVCLKQKDDSLLGFIMNYLETRFGIRRETNDTGQSEESEAEPSTERERARERKVDMAARPLPVPVENEPYYMNIDRTEAEHLLMNQPDGAFVLRPSSQPNHAYTLSVACAHSVHNVGVRRRPDGRLALGFARRGERSFTSVTSLLRHHKKRRLLLVAAGDLIGATTLNDTPQYYQTPSDIPILSA